MTRTGEGLRRKPALFGAGFPVRRKPLQSTGLARMKHTFRKPQAACARTGTPSHRPAGNSCRGHARKPPGCPGARSPDANQKPPGLAGGSGRAIPPAKPPEEPPGSLAPTLPAQAAPPRPFPKGQRPAPPRKAPRRGSHAPQARSGRPGSPSALCFPARQAGPSQGRDGRRKRVSSSLPGSTSRGAGARQIRARRLSRIPSRPPRKGKAKRCPGFPPSPRGKA